MRALVRHVAWITRPISVHKLKKIVERLCIPLAERLFYGIGGGTIHELRS
jgi:hypothetical protein